MPVISNSALERSTKGEGTESSGLRSRKRKADVAIFLQDPDETLDCLEMTKKKQYQERGPWSNEIVCKSPHNFIPTPEKEANEQILSSYQPHFSSLRFSPAAVSPLPHLGWANQNDVWRHMLNKDRTYLRDKNFFQNHPQLQPNMRSILLDWLMEVCEVYKLHRETFYLAQDFFDRFMTTQHNVIKSQLQLIGITTLFIAAKLEEIYPPKLHQFAFITDGACIEDEITSMELMIMKALDWCLSPMTVVSWFNVYLQVTYIKELQHFLLPQFPQEIYVQIVQLLDLCVLDIGCLEYPYCVLAASAFYHFSCPEVVEKVSGMWLGKNVYSLKGTLY
ncbi:hypothetical protein GDO86_008167 [Hymenochirus boettgeri]|uniref:Cyclin-like domain-containing protein n=1 Tax=Hymenochirus boettgeri TaxID=247094 RepID=A0A8T2J0G7_9PIPI|nr:hypothetical protein GDO86_008167 [Hymenochirus boettgeri]